MLILVKMCVGVFSCGFFFSLFSTVAITKSGNGRPAAARRNTADDQSGPPSCAENGEFSHALKVSSGDCSTRYSDGNALVGSRVRFGRQAEEREKKHQSQNSLSNDTSFWALALSEYRTNLPCLGPGDISRCTSVTEWSPPDWRLLLSRFTAKDIFKRLWDLTR